MKEQIEKLSKKLKKQLGKRIINDDRKMKLELSKAEILMIEQFINIKVGQYSLPMIVKISDRYNLDFIWWDREVDVLLCSNRK